MKTVLHAFISYHLDFLWGTVWLSSVSPVCPAFFVGTKKRHQIFHWPLKHNWLKVSIPFYFLKSHLKSRFHLFIFYISCTATKFLLSGPSPWHLIQWECDQRPSENVMSPQYGVHPLWQHINQLNINHTVLETAQLTPGNLWAPGKIGHPPTCGGVVARGCWLLLVEISLEEDAAPKVPSRRLLPLPIVCMENADLSAHTQIILTNWKPKP